MEGLSSLRPQVPHYVLRARVHSADLVFSALPLRSCHHLQRGGKVRLEATHVGGKRAVYLESIRDIGPVIGKHRPSDAPVT